MDLIEYNNQLLEEINTEEEYSKLFYDKFSSAQKQLAKNIEDYDQLHESVYAEYDPWLEKRKTLLKEYANFLKYNNLNPNRFKSNNSIELFTGSYDTLKHCYKNSIEVYSKYASTLATTAPAHRIHHMEIGVRNGRPCYVLHVPNSDTKLYVPFNYFFDRIYVQNPHTSKERSMMERLVANEDLSVIYGLYGSPLEEDIDKRISDLQRLKTEIEGAKFMEYRGETKKLGPYHIGLIYKPRQK